MGRDLALPWAFKCKVWLGSSFLQRGNSQLTFCLHCCASYPESPCPAAKIFHTTVNSCRAGAGTAPPVGILTQELSCTQQAVGTAAHSPRGLLRDTLVSRGTGCSLLAKSLLHFCTPPSAAGCALLTWGLKSLSQLDF